VLGGRVILRQPAKGYRAGLDAALLAAACDAKPGEVVADAGCGVGGVMLAAAVRRPAADRFIGFEVDRAAWELAEQNIAANGLGERVFAQYEDILDPPRMAWRMFFDAILCNPPFFDDAGAIRGPHPAKRRAFMADAGLGTWVRALLAVTRQGATLTLIHRAERLADLLALLGAKAGSFQVRPVHPFADEPAGRVLVRAVRGGRAPLRLLPPLVLHERGRLGHTPTVEAILRGEADLPWL
jgi:tRNA1(Val) A37 N6-methylase TrmN6